MICEKVINIDLSHPYVGEVLNFHEGDVNGFGIRLNVFNDSVSFDLTGCTVKFDAVIGNYLAECNEDGAIDDNSIVIPVTGAMTAYPGNLRIDVRIIKNEETLFFRTFRAYVQPRVITDDIVTPGGESIADAITRMSEDVEYAVEKVDEKMDYAPGRSPNTDDNKGQVFYTENTIGVKTSDGGSFAPITSKEAYTKEASDVRYARPQNTVRIAEAYTNPTTGQIGIDDAIENGVLYLYKNSVGTVIGTIRSAGLITNNYKRIQIRELGGSNPEISYRIIDYSNNDPVYGSWIKLASMNDIDSISQVPSGGTTGQVLTKTSNGFAWQSLPVYSGGVQ